MAHVADELVEVVVPEEARVIAFGESTHGTREFRELAYTVALRYAEEHDDVTFAIESSALQGSVRNEYVRGCGNIDYQGELAPPAVYTSELEFLELVKEHNAKGRGCIRIVGVDAPAGRYLEQTPGIYGRRCLGEWTAPMLRLLAGVRPDDPASLRNVVAEIRALRAKKGERRLCLELDWWLLQLEERAAMPPSESDVMGLPTYVHEIDRDELMARNIQFWAEHSEKVVWLVHAGHAFDGSIPAARGSGSTKAAGDRVSAAIGDAYFDVVTAFGEGTLLAMPCHRRGRFTLRKIPAPRHPSLERDLFADITSPTALTSDDACRGRNCTAMRWYVYCLPHGFEDHKLVYKRLEVATGFDAIAFFPRAHGESTAPNAQRARRRRTR